MTLAVMLGRTEDGTGSQLLKATGFELPSVHCETEGSIGS